MQDERISRDAQAQWHLTARILLSLGLLGAGLWMLSNYVRALIWAAVLAIAIWPLFKRTAARTSASWQRDVLPFLFTLAVALVFVLPFAVLSIEAARQAHTVLDYAKQAEQNGIPVPEAVSRLPESVVKPATDWWNSNLAHSGWAKEYAAKFDTASNREFGREAGLGALHGIVLFSTGRV